jgi:DNA polymerase-3 subunit delta'
MNLKQKIKFENPIFYKTILNAWNRKVFSHNYLLSFDLDAQIEDQISFLLQALVCDKKNDFACGECFNCKNVIKYNLLDLYVLDGKDNEIKKAEVLQVNNALQQTASSSDSPKILLIKHIDNANLYSLNSLLKFIEEPTDNTYIISTTNKISKVLKTITSRSQIIKINKKNIKQIITSLNAERIENKYLYVLAYLFKDKKLALKNYELDFKKQYKEFIISMENFIDLKEKGLRTLSLYLKNVNVNKIKFSIIRLFLNDI